MIVHMNMHNWIKELITMLNWQDMFMNGYYQEYSEVKQYHTSSLLLLSHFSRVRLYATPQMAAHQAPPSLGFSRQEHWSGLPFPSPMHESGKWKWSHSVVDCSPPGSSVHRIFQARVQEWVASAFSDTSSLACIIFFSFAVLPSDYHR